MNRNGSLILKNGVVHTLDPQQPAASTVVIRDGRIAAVGDESIIDRFDTAGIEQIDLAGRVVVPGFIDTHVHFTISGLGMLAVDLDGVDQIDEVLRRIKVQAGEFPAGALVLASGFQPELNEGHRFPTPDELDAAADGRPVYVMERGGHWSAVNEAALALLPLTPESEGIGRNSQGKFTGVLTDAANMSAFTTLWHIYKRQIGVDRAFVRAAQAAAEGGVTTLHALDDLDDVRSLLAISDQLPVRVVPYTQSKDVATVREFGLRQIGGCGQVALDGDFGPHTAALLEPYTDQPDNCGTLFFSDQEVESYVENAHLAGLQVALHCVGSGAIEQLLQAYEHVLARHPRADHRHRIEHFELPAPGQAERARGLGLLLALQPAFNHYWPHDGEYPNVVGERRAQMLDPVRSVVDHGIHAAFGSDSPVTPMAPLTWIHSATHHSNAAERIDAETALRLCSEAGAYFAFEEHDKGTITVGKLGDLVVLDGDPLAAATADSSKVSMTMVGGTVVYRA